MLICDNICLSRKQKGSNRRARAKLKVAKLHFRISNQRQAVLHQLSDAGFGYLRQQIEYKAK
ncbi:MAG: hypothetical protein VSS52_006530, partial [Thiotrichaceae bacterium]|nr:hypothetical protein [Thiotrichaceae bacterium]